MDDVYVVYMLKCADATLYIGVTNDMARRLHSHNTLKSGAKYTRARRPVRLVYQEVCATKGEALKREFALKQLSRQDKIALIDQMDSSTAPFDGSLHL